MKPLKTIIITGTHHTPAIELIKILQADSNYNWQIHYIGHLYSSETHILHTIIPKLKVSFINLNSGKFDRKNLVPTIKSIPKTITSIFKSFQLIKKIKPNIVVSFGGYVSVPVIIASFLNKIPTITHEQTLTESLSTKINRLFVSKVALSFAPNKLDSKDVVTGNLIRSDVFKKTSSKFENLKLKIKTHPLIYITGGNQGSEFINNLVINLLPELSEFTIIHQTGNKNVPHQKLANYHQYEYIEIEDIGWVLNNSAIIISRAGANTCQEIDLLNKSCIIIPLIFTQQDEQTKNALWLQKRHPKNTIVITQNLATPKLVIDSIHKLPKSIQPTTRRSTILIHPLVKLIYEITK